MDSTKSSVPRSSKSNLARKFAKILHIRALTGITPVDGTKKLKLQSKPIEEQLKNEPSKIHQPVPLDENKFEEDLRKREALEAILAKTFACVSSVKASYAQLQCAQTPYNAAGIESADKLIVTELKNLSEVKQSYIKKQFDLSPQKTLTLAEIQENKSLLKTYEIMGRKLELQAKVKESEAASLMENLSELSRENRAIEKKLNQSGQLSVLDNLHLSGVNPNHFATVLHHAVKSIRSFVRLMIDEMKSADWNTDAAAYAIEPNITYWSPDHKCFAFESFICREMFGSFQYPNFSLPNESLPERGNPSRTFFFGRFLELKPLRAKEYLARNPRSAFAKFCRVKYLQLVHPKMESGFFGNLAQRNLVNSGSFPETDFFAVFSEMARRVWLLHCLAFSFETEVSVFQVAKGCRFSEVYMESVVNELPECAVVDDAKVAFTVVPGFKIGKTVIQCKVYVSNCGNSR